MQSPWLADIWCTRAPAGQHMGLDSPCGHYLWSIPFKYRVPSSGNWLYFLSMIILRMQPSAFQGLGSHVYGKIRTYDVNKTPFLSVLHLVCFFLLFLKYCLLGLFPPDHHSDTPYVQSAFVNITDAKRARVRLKMTFLTEMCSFQELGRLLQRTSCKAR